MPKKRTLIALDFTEHDTIGLLELLMSLCRENKIAGMVYAVSLKGANNRRDVICGATGKLADDSVQAAGLTTMLNSKFASDAISRTQEGRN